MRLQSSGLLGSADRSDGSFTLAPPLLQTLAGGALADGAHALHLKATDKAGNISRLDLSFILDTKIAPPCDHALILPHCANLPGSHFARRTATIYAALLGITLPAVFQEFPPAPLPGCRMIPKRSDSAFDAQLKLSPNLEVGSKLGRAY